ncbi:MAG: type II toxin-antitoxin system YafQ family toxin [Victivallales bacterium]|nr:type II toxin-antitoxin system YafQ family toxin [Victivallales bacterium]
MNYRVRATTRFRKDYKLLQRRGLDMSKLEAVVALLAAGATLAEQYHDHALVGDFAGFRECHVTSDWLLVYCIENDLLILTLSRTGTHSDLFGK